MLCCVPKSLTDGDPFHDEAPFYDEAPFHDQAPFHDEASNNTRYICKTWIKLYPEEDASAPILLPCAICARTFMPQSLEKHARICERAAAKKRKPFDSAKQRIQGTELAEFLPKQELRRHHQDEKATKPSWKKIHDDFLQTIREARGEIMDLSNKQCNSLISSGAPTRANEKGTCPTCNRQFGIKAYDRHVAWCKDRITRMPVNPATNLAKERLEARMRYKAPVIKNRRAINREKYSPGSAVNQSTKTSVSSPAIVKQKESISVTNSNRQSPVKQKPAIVKRPGQLKESLISSGPMKSRLIDRTNKPAEDHNVLTSTSCGFSHFAISSRPLHFPVSPVKFRINSDSVSSNGITSPTISFRQQSDRNETISQRIPNDDTKNQEICSAKTQKNIVSARSQGHPTINDISVNDNTLGMIVQPYRIHSDTQKDGQLVTWKQISSKKNNLQRNDSVISYNLSQEFQLLDLDESRCDREDKINTIEKKNKTEKELSITKNDFTQVNELKDSKINKLRSDKLTWLNDIQNLNQTYLIKDSEDMYNESLEILHSKWKPIKHSPRVFYFKDRENENEFNKSDRKIIANDEEIKTAKQESKINIKNKKDTDVKVMEHKVEKLKVNSKDEKDNWKVNNKEIEVIECKIEKLNIDIGDKDNRLIDEENKVTDNDVKKLEINIESKKDFQRIDDTNIAEFDKINVNKEDGKNKPTAIDNGIVENIKYTVIEENEQNLLDFDEHIQLSRNASKESFKKLKVSSTDSIDDLIFLENLFRDSFETSSSKHQDSALHTDDKNNLKFSDNLIHLTQDDINLKNKILQYENDTCCNLLKLQKNAAAFICNQSDKNMMSSNSCSNRADEDEKLPCQNNAICCNLLDLTENKVISSSATSRAISPEKDSTKNAEKTEINEDMNREIRKNDLIILYNKDSERNLKELNSETSLSQNSEIFTNEPNACTNNISPQIKVNRHQECFFDFENFKNIEDCLKNGKTDFNTDIDKRSRDKSSHSIIKTEVTTSEGLRKRNIDNVDNEKFNYDSDNIVSVGEHNTRGANDLVSSVTLKDNVETQYRRDETFLKASVNLSKGIFDSTKSVVEEHPANSVEIKHKIKENMNRLRGSTNSLISSIELIDLANIRRPKANYSYEQESIKIIRPKRSRVFKGLPDIRNSAETRRESNRERSYWESASKIPRNRLIDLDSIHTKYKFVKRNPRVHILPPVPSPSLIERRKIELTTRPAWCNYVRRRPNFNLVLKARTSTGKDYDPFLRAEQQMNDLLSDMSDQSITGSPKQIHSNLYPLSHSSAFVKYPISPRRSSLIEPPTEFDDVASDLSSDSTETNSISREIFLSKPVLTSKDITDASDIKPIKGRRVIIDKSKALGVDERRGVIGSADRPHKIFDKVTPLVTKPLIDRSNSIRASSAPKFNSGFDRKISSRIKKVPDSTITEDQSLSSRSSDQSFNQSNNNYSSLSGSNLSLNSIISSSELDVKRSNSMFDELMTCFKEDEFNLRSFLNNESFDLSSSSGDRQRNGSLISDGELSSPDSYKPRDHSKLSNDSAYSSLNRKYSHHGRSTNDVIGRLDEDVSRNETSPIQTTIKCKLSKFCHECGQQFPEIAKYCCECGVKRLAL